MENGSGKGMEVGSFLLHHKRWMELSKLHDKHKDLLESIAYLEKMDRGPREHKSLEELWREEQELRKKQKELLNSLGLEYRKGAESESGKGTEIDYGKELEKERDYGKEPEKERDSGKEPEKERDYGKEPEKERDSGKEPEKERDYGKEPEKERDSGKEPGKERESGKEPDMEMTEMKDRRKLNKKQRKLLKQKQKKLMKKRLKERDSGDLLGSFAPTFSGKHQSLVKEIISVERERRDLLGSLTPTFSLWKEIDSQRTWTIARNEKPANSSSRDNDDENQLVDYFNLTLQDMEDLGHRMLSMLYFLNKSNERIFSHKATELCNTAAELNAHISKEFSTNHEQEQETEREEEPWQINLSSLFRKFSRSPDNYNNTLAKSVIEEDEMRKYKGFKVEDEYQDEDESTMEFLKKRMEVEQQFFANHRTYWEDVWGSRIGRCGGFMDTTILSSMQFTHYTPGSIPSPAAVAGSTLQIYSIKIKNLKGLNWPLRVYGEVAARDTVDYNRNILFSRSEFNYQELNGEDDSLCLTGPSRAIVALRHVDFEVELQVTDGAQSQTLISRRKRYGCTDAFFSSLANVTDGGDGRTFLISNQSCTAEVTLDQLARSLQATIVGVRVTEGGWPFKHGCRVVCSWFPAAQISSSDTSCRRVVLLDHRGSGMRRGSDKYLHLSRKVVSVESYGTLRVKIEAYGKSHRYIARMCQIDFPVRKCQTERFKCPVGHGGPTVEVTVAWSLLVEEKVHLSLVDCPAI